jgi:hypothetical protein
MSEDEFTRFFQYMQREFKWIHTKLKDMASKAALDSYVDAVDAFAKRNETYYQELLALGHQVDRHGRWIRQIADVGGGELSA